MSNEHVTALQRMRDSVDNIDAALIHLLAERFRLTNDIGTYKATHALSATDAARESAQLRRLRSLAEAAQLDPEFAVRILEFIRIEVKHQHRLLAHTAPLR